MLDPKAGYVGRGFERVQSMACASKLKDGYLRDIFERIESQGGHLQELHANFYEKNVTSGYGTE